MIGKGRSECEKEGTRKEGRINLGYSDERKDEIDTGGEGAREGRETRAVVEEV